jgi:hypothetical protein
MKSFWRFACPSFLLGAAALAACSGGTKAVPNSPLLNLITVSTPLPLTGGTLALSNGSSATVEKKTLSRAQSVTLSYDPTATSVMPSKAWSAVPGDLSVHFQYPLIATLVPPTPPPSHPAPRPSSLPIAVKLTMHYAPPPQGAAPFAHTVIVTAQYPVGASKRFGLYGTFDRAAQTVSVSVPAVLAGGATSMQLSLDTDAPGYALPSPGPRYWNGKSWSTTGTIDPQKRTLVFIHGIFSSVETAFPCAQSILNAGGYQQGVGFDYNWTEPPQVEGPLFATFLNSLAARGLTSFDIEAHSYGTVVTYAAIPSVNATLPHVVTLGGPLPLEGTPLAHGALLRLVLVALADVFVGPPSLIDDAYESGMVASLGTNSPEMQQIEIGVRGMKVKPAFVQVAGTTEYPDEAYLYPALYFYITYPWDGIVEQIAATSVDIPNAIPHSFPLEHTQLECTPAVYDYVGTQVQPSSRR